MLSQDLIYTIEFRNIIVEITFPSDFFEVSVKTIINKNFPEVDFKKSIKVLESSLSVNYKWKNFIKEILKNESNYKVLKTKRLKPIHKNDLHKYFHINISDDIFINTDEPFQNYLKIMDENFLLVGES